MINIILVTAACAIISYIVWNYYCWMSFVKTVNLLPGPKTLPFFGNAYYFISRRSEGYLKIINELAENYASPFRIWIGNKLFIVIYEPDHIKTILQSRHCLEKNIMLEFFKPLLGMGLITAPASIWKQNRKIIAPHFNTNILRRFFDTFHEQSLLFVNKLERIGLNESGIELFEHIMTCNINIVFDTIMGVKLDWGKSDQFTKAFLRFKEIVKYRLQNPFLLSDIIFNFTALGREQRNHLKTFHSFIDEITQQQIREINKLDATKTNSNTFRKIFCDNVMKELCQRRFTQKTIRDNIITIIFAAIDTTSMTLYFVIFILSNFPEIQNKLYKELLKIYGTENLKSAPIKYEDLQYMSYLECVIKETMRIFPTVPITGRKTTKDVKMGEFILPKGANIIINSMLMHRNKNYWPNPWKFDPDRFLPDKMNNHSYYYLPFSDGPRNCIGSKYAMISMKVFLATLVRTFKFKVNKSLELDKIRLDIDIILNTIEPLKVQIEKRHLQ